jgi:hypothetical protein
MDDVKTDYVKEYRDVAVKTTDGSLFRGKLNICHNRRLSDLFRCTADEFIVLVDVVHGESEGEKTVIINKHHIVWAEPGD